MEVHWSPAQDAVPCILSTRLRRTRRLALSTSGIKETLWNIRRLVKNITTNTWQTTKRWILPLFRVPDQRFFSFHSWIVFSLHVATEVSKPFRDPRRIGCRKYGQVHKNKLSGEQISKIGTVDELESEAGGLEKAFGTTFKVSSPTKYSKKTLPLWRSEDLCSLRKLTRETFNICYRDKYCQSYKNCLKKYNSAVKTVKTRSWLAYYRNIESISKSSRLSKIQWT